MDIRRMNVYTEMMLADFTKAKLCEAFGPPHQGGAHTMAWAVMPKVGELTIHFLLDANNARQPVVWLFNPYGSGLTSTEHRVIDDERRVDSVITMIKDVINAH